MLKTNPARCLQVFWRSCGALGSDLNNMQNNPNNADKSLLYDDLSMLINCSIEQIFTPLLIIGAKDDRVANPEIVLTASGNNTYRDIRVLPCGEHLLGYRYPEVVCEQVFGYYQSTKQYRNKDNTNILQMSCSNAKKSNKTIF